MNLVILKKSADSDETDDSMYAVDSSDHGEYGKYCQGRCKKIGLCPKCDKQPKKQNWEKLLILIRAA